MTTAICVMGKDKAIDFINRRLTDCKVTFAVREQDGTLSVYTNALASEITLNTAHGNLRLQASGDGNGRIEVKNNVA